MSYGGFEYNQGGGGGGGGFGGFDVMSGFGGGGFGMDGGGFMGGGGEVPKSAEKKVTNLSYSFISLSFFL